MEFTSITKEEFLHLKLSDPKYRYSLDTHLSIHFPNTLPILKLHITSDQTNLEYDLQDLQQAFSRFGEVKSLKNQHPCVVIEFFELREAFLCQQILNDTWLDNLHLKLSFCEKGEQKKKLTCKYDLFIEEDGFQLAKKLIGQKGSNMKKVIEQALKGQTSYVKNDPDAVKLRLRGRGSGYKEGPDKKECNEQMHLCVSAKYEGVFKEVCRVVETLLKEILKEYENFCRDSGVKARKHAIVKNVNNQTVSLETSLMKENINQIQMNSRLSEQVILSLIEARNQCRRQLDFKRADKIRELLKVKGVVLIDEKGRRGSAEEVTHWKVVNQN